MAILFLLFVVRCCRPSSSCSKERIWIINYKDRAIERIPKYCLLDGREKTRRRCQQNGRYVAPLFTGKEDE